ncbi:MAG: hypothetical protein K6F33_15315 [Bacteroidales bacterium]|nr:hypothetical protein [Bacteroidales bacterium]
MKKITILAAFLLVMAGCGSESSVGDKQMNKFLTDLSQAYLSDFNGPNPDDMIKIDFAVKRLVKDSPDAFAKDGKFLVIDAEKVHATSDKYFAYPIETDKFTNEVDDFKDGKYYYRSGDEQEFVFSIAEHILGSKGDTIMVNAQTYSCKPGWKGDFNVDPSNWESVDPDNIPKKGKNMRTVLVKKADGYRVLSYIENKAN